jgi:hypothetical protein
MMKIRPRFYNIDLIFKEPAKSRRIALVSSLPNTVYYVKIVINHIKNWITLDDFMSYRKNIGVFLVIFLALTLYFSNNQTPYQKQNP